MISIKEFGGIPFVDSGFNATALVSAVAAGRSRWNPKANIHDLLDTTVARRSLEMGTHKRLPALPVSIALTPLEVANVADSIELILSRKPHWKPLLSIPVQIRRWVEEERGSMTNPLYPQAVLIGGKIIVEKDQLHRTIVHEMSHVWLSFIAELSDFQIETERRNYTLPSGSVRVGLRSVVLAAHYAATMATYISPSIDDERLSEIDYYCRYVRECETIVSSSSGATPIGREIMIRLVTATKNIEDSITLPRPVHSR